MGVLLLTGTAVGETETHSYDCVGTVRPDEAFNAWIAA